MKKIVIIFVVILFLSVSADVFAEESDTLSISLKSRIDKLTVRKKHYLSIGNSDMYFEPDTIEKKVSDIGFLIGPQVEYFIHKHKPTTSLRAFFILGNSDFSGSGTIKRKTFGVDVRIGKPVGVLIGYRNREAIFEDWTSTNMNDHSISDTVFGVFFRTDPYDDGFYMDFEMIFGIQGMSTFFETSDEGRLKEFFISENELNFGYRFKSVPLRLVAGYGLWAYEDYEREYRTVLFGVPFNHIERWEDWSHGGTLRVEYSF